MQNKPFGRWHGVLRLLFVIWKKMPVTTALWLFVPMCLGLFIWPLMTAERKLIDLAAGGLHGQSWQEMLNRAWPILALFAGTMLLQTVVSAVRRITDEVLSAKATRYVHSEIQRIAVGVPLERFEHPEFFDLQQRAKATAGEELLGILRSTVEIMQLVCTFVGMLIIVSKGHWLLPILVIAVNAAALAVRVKVEIAIRRQNRDLTTDGRMSDYLKQTMTDEAVLKESKIFGSTGYLLDQWSNLTRSALSKRYGMRRVESRLSAWLTLANTIVIVAALLLMFSKLRHGAMTAGTVAVVFQAIGRAYGNPMKLSWFVSRMYLASSKAIDLVEFLSEPLAEANGTDNPTGPLKTISFENVSFTYPRSSGSAISGLNLTIRQGETIAVVGENGAGKSTFIRLLLGLYKPTTGKVTWNGMDLVRLDLRRLWERTSAVFQDSEPYPFSVRDNVAFGKLTAAQDDEAIRGALAASGLAELAACLDAPLGRLTEGGRDLSGGQWQRLAIARAMFRGGELIVLDEPTAAIDPNSEMELFEKFRQASLGKTAIFVSHRLGWARHADRILVMQGGKLAEDGSHNELMARNGFYASFFREQASWYQADGA